MDEVICILLNKPGLLSADLNKKLQIGTVEDFVISGNNKSNGQQRTLKLIAIGGIKPIKNQQFILDAFEHLKGLDVTCDIYGDGDQKSELEKRAKENGLQVFFKGNISDPSRVLSDYDIYIMPSLTEGFPLALFEAMASRLPVVVSDIPVFHEILDNQGNYVSLQNPAQLRTVLEPYLQNRDRVIQEGDQMRQLALRKAGKEVYLKKLRFLYHSMVGTK
jgi:glycosyltransferase involved in cell wall biosynthesis